MSVSGARVLLGDNRETAIINWIASIDTTYCDHNRDMLNKHINYQCIVLFVVYRRFHFQLHCFWQLRSRPFWVNVTYLSYLWFTFEIYFQGLDRSVMTGTQEIVSGTYGALSFGNIPVIRPGRRSLREIPEQATPSNSFHTHKKSQDVQRTTAPSSAVQDQKMQLLAECGHLLQWFPSG